MGEHYAEFGLFKDRDLSPSSLACCGCDMIIYYEIKKSNDSCPNNPPIFDYVSAKCLELNCANMGLDAYLPPCIAKDEPSTVNVDSLSD